MADAPVFAAAAAVWVCQVCETCAVRLARTSSKVRMPSASLAATASARNTRGFGCERIFGAHATLATNEIVARRGSGRRGPEMPPALHSESFIASPRDVRRQI